MLLTEDQKKILIEHLVSISPDISFKNTQFSEISVNDYSFCIEVSSNYHEIYIKIPKRNQAYKSLKDRTILPLTTEDINFAKAEYESLKNLFEVFQDFESFQVIEPIIYIEELNAIVTKKFQGFEFFNEVRKIPFSNESKEGVICKQIVSLARSISKISSQIKYSNQPYNSKKILTKISQYLKEIEEYDFLKNEEYFYTHELKPLFTNHANTIKGYKGLDIRNILVNSYGNLCLLDPGKSKEETREAFFARFYATLVIVYWGSPLFIFRFESLARVCELFLETIKEDAGFDNLIFNFELRKEFIKHWSLARRALEFKRFPNCVKKFIRKYYIDRFYIKILKENKSSFLLESIKIS